MKRNIFLLIIGVYSLTASDFTLLPRETSYTKPFFDKYPEYNGKGVTIFVMDTGIEPTLAGLDKNPDGSTKVVDVYDASQIGDHPVTKALTREVENELYLTDMVGIYLKDFSQYSVNPDDFYIGIFKEDDFKNSSPKDINDNGTTDDEWGFVIFMDGDGVWNFVMDMDRDQSLRNEDILNDYHINYDLITFKRAHPVFRHDWFSMAINIYADRKIVSFHYEDGGHGTHVAGIAAGYQINGDLDANGLAPGASLVSIKIGAGSMPGSATTTGAKKRGLKFIEDYMRRHPGQAVINMSFGIESSNEGFSEVEKLANKFCVNNPNVMFCTSAGNNGPGISTIGAPAGAQFVIASGALMDPVTGRDKYGYVSDKPRLIHFSSRGGDTAKPDVVSPGAMFSSVTEWDQGNFKWGTSMSSPYTAGVVASVISGIQLEYPDNEISSAFLTTGLMKTSSKLYGYSKIEQGAGVINMMELFRWLKKNIKDPMPPMYQLATETFNPGRPDIKSNSVYWRISDVEAIPEKNEITLIPKFSESTPKFLVDDFFLKYKIKSDAGWVVPAQKNISVHRDNKTNMNVRIDPSKIPENSMKTAMITLEPDGPYQKIEQIFYVSAINPIKFNRMNNHTYKQENIAVKPGEANHNYISIPFGTTGMHVEISSVENKYSFVRTYLFNENGIESRRFDNINSVNGINHVEATITRGLQAGVWELVTYGDLGGERESFYNLEISFYGVGYDDDEKKLSFTKNTKPTISGTIFPILDSYQNVEIRGSIDGYGKDHILEMGKSDTVSISFYKTSQDRSVQFNFEIPAERYSYFTDLATMIQDDSGKSVKSRGMGFSKDQIILSENTPEGHYELMLIYAYTDQDNTTEFEIPVEELHLFKDTIHSIHQLPNNSLYNGIPYKYKMTYDDLPKIIPTDYIYSGELKVVQRGDRVIANKRLKIVM